MKTFSLITREQVCWIFLNSANRSGIVIHNCIMIYSSKDSGEKRKGILVMSVCADILTFVEHTKCMIAWCRGGGKVRNACSAWCICVISLFHPHKFALVPGTCFIFGRVCTIIERSPLWTSVYPSYWLGLEASCALHVSLYFLTWSWSPRLCNSPDSVNPPQTLLFPRLSTCLLTLTSLRSPAISWHIYCYLYSVLLFSAFDKLRGSQPRPRALKQLNVVMPTIKKHSEWQEKCGQWQHRLYSIKPPEFVKCKLETVTSENKMDTL